MNDEKRNLVWEDFLAGVSLRGEDVEDPEYLARLQSVWETREARVRGFRSSLSSAPGECAVCYRETVPREGIHICERCLQRDPKARELAEKLAACGSIDVSFPSEDTDG